MLLLGVFADLAKTIISSGGSVSFEWPAYCVGWQIPGLEDFFNKMGFSQISCHRCAFGLEHRGRLIKKLWKIVSTHKPLLVKLEKYKCQCPKGSHAPCTGGATSNTENYTPPMASVIVAGTLVPGFRPSAPEHAKLNSMSGQASPDWALRGDRCVPSGEALDRSYAGSGEADMTDADRAMAARFSDGDGQHRERDTSSPVPFLGLVVRTIPPSSAEFHSDKGRTAIKEEIDDLRKDLTWDESSAAEWSTVRHIKHNGFTPMSGLLFIIMGQKNSELVGTVPEDQCPYRARAVF